MKTYTIGVMEFTGITTYQVEVQARHKKAACAAALKRVEGAEPPTGRTEAYEGAIPFVYTIDGEDDAPFFFGEIARNHPNVADLVAAGRTVLERWEKGDLAAAVRKLNDALAKFS